MNFLLLHGTGGTGDNFWFPWLARELEIASHSVQRPDLPDADTPDLAVWTPYILKHATIDSDTIIVGHSAGCMATLSVLQQLRHPIKRAILVAGFIGDLPNVPADNPVYLRDPDWDKIKRNGGEFYFINSDDDPWGCTNLQGERLREKLGGTLIVPTGARHMGSVYFDQPYPNFPLLKALCLLS